MQAYALAVRELMPDLVKAGSEIKVTLHFLDPNVEFHLTEDLLETNACAHAIDQAFLQLISSREPEHFPVRPATHCRMCNFLQICAAGREWIAKRQTRRWRRRGDGDDGDGARWGDGETGKRRNRLTCSSRVSISVTPRLPVSPSPLVSVSPHLRVPLSPFPPFPCIL